MCVVLFLLHSPATGKDAHLDNSKIIKDLQMTFLPLSSTMVDMVEALTAVDMLPPGVKKASASATQQ